MQETHPSLKNINFLIKKEESIQISPNGNKPVLKIILITIPKYMSINTYKKKKIYIYIYIYTYINTKGKPIYPA